MRVLLVLGRVSNLPTVWSNCLAAWILASGRDWARFALVCLGATLLYTGGMFLNDAVDVGFDRRYRAERPIPSGRITARAVWGFSVVLLITGWGVFIVLGKLAAEVGWVLLLAIVLYDVVHKRTKLAPLLMAACRLLLYLLAASSTGAGVNTDVRWRALALAAYIVGLSYLARGESTGGQRLKAWNVLLLLAPLLIAFARPLTGVLAIILVGAFEVAWTCWCLSARSSRLTMLHLPKGVAGLLAGIVLVDWLAAAGHGSAVAFLLLFVLALWLQRVAPAT